MRGLQHDPVVEIHPDTAAKEGIQEGDWVVIESLRGKIRQRAKFFKGLRPEVISAEHAWWFPEEKENHGDWESSNVNMLIDNSYDNCDPAMGATHIRSLLCRVYPEKRIEE
jgi:anaerobic selenocysteine-containing dehydrogenase